MGMTNRGKKLTGWFDGPWFDPYFASDNLIIIAPGPSLGKGRTLGPHHRPQRKKDPLCPILMTPGY